MIQFKDKTAIVTGSTRGIGKEIAMELESKGAKVIVTGTSSVAPEFIGNGNFLYLSVDFTDSNSTDHFLKEVSKIDDISICINNAGINKINFLEDCLDTDLDNMLSVNLEVPFKLTRIFAKNMKKNGYGRIVNISSIFGSLSREKRSIYSMTKAGIHGLTVTSSIELSKYNILVNTVSPGFTLTDLTRKNLSQADMDKLNTMIPMQRMADVKEISNVVLFLCSELNTYLTGQNIVVDGGFSNV